MNLYREIFMGTAIGLVGGIAWKVRRRTGGGWTKRAAEKGTQERRRRARRASVGARPAFTPLGRGRRGRGHELTDASPPPPRPPPLRSPRVLRQIYHFRERKNVADYYRELEADRAKESS